METLHFKTADHPFLYDHEAIVNSHMTFIENKRGTEEKLAKKEGNKTKLTIGESVAKKKKKAAEPFIEYTRSSTSAYQVQTSCRKKKIKRTKN